MARKTKATGKTRHQKNREKAVNALIDVFDMLKINTTELADYMGVPEGTIVNWLNRRAVPNTKSTTIINEWLDVWRADLYGGIQKDEKDRLDPEGYELAEVTPPKDKRNGPVKTYVPIEAEETLEDERDEPTAISPISAMLDKAEDKIRQMQAEKAEKEEEEEPTELASLPLTNKVCNMILMASDATIGSVMRAFAEDIYNGERDFNWTDSENEAANILWIRLSSEIEYTEE